MTNYPTAATDTTSRVTTARRRVMMSLTRLEGGVGYSVLRSFYVHAVRSLLDYSAPCLLTTSSSTLETLEVVQTIALRALLEAPLWSRICNIRLEGRLLSVEALIRHFTTSHLVTLLRRSPTSLPIDKLRRTLPLHPVLHSKRTRASIAVRFISEKGQGHLFLHQSIDGPYRDYLRRPWEPPPFLLCTFRLSAINSSVSAIALSTEATQLLNRVDVRENAVHYNTDGFLDVSLRFWCRMCGIHMQ